MPDPQDCLHSPHRPCSRIIYDVKGGSGLHTLLEQGLVSQLVTSQEDVPWRGADGHPGQGYILGEELESTDEQRVGRRLYGNRHHVPSWVGRGSGGAGSGSGLAYSHGHRSRWKQDLRGPTNTLQPIDKLPPSLGPRGLGLGLGWPQGWCVCCPVH